MKFSDLKIEMACCINLAHRTDRKQHAMDQIKKLGIQVEFFQAIDGKSMDHTAVSQNHTPGMVGVFLSHREIYRQAIDRNAQSLLVLEDDFYLQPGFDYLMQKALTEIPADAQLLFFGFYPYGGTYSYQEKTNAFWAVPSYGWGAHAYLVIGQKAIRTLYEQTSKMHMQIDEQLIQMVLPYRLKHYMIIPSAIGQKAMGTDCQIKNPNS